MDKYEAREQQVIDRYIQASYGLWNALLTINGIMLAASTFISSSLSLINFITLFLALISIGLLTHNYVVIKITYFRIGQVISGDLDELTEEKKKKDIDVSLSRNKRVQWFENICLSILFIQALLIISSYWC